MSSATTQTMTAGEIHRLVTSPWCPKCGLNPQTEVWSADEGTCHYQCVKCKEPVLPGLFDRLPETRPEGLEWSEKYHCWRQRQQPHPTFGWEFAPFVVSGEAAEERIIGRLVKVAPTQIARDAIDGLIGDDSLLHALVCAFHRWLDSQEDSP